MLGWVLLEKMAKGNGTSRKDHFVSLQLLAPVARDGHVHELGLVAQVRERRLDALLEVVPSQAKLLLRRSSHFAKKAENRSYKNLPAQVLPVPTSQNRTKRFCKSNVVSISTELTNCFITSDKNVKMRIITAAEFGPMVMDHHI